MYKCDQIATDCQSCQVSLNNKYECGWCTLDNTCRISENCLEQSHWNKTCGNSTRIGKPLKFSILFIRLQKII